MFIDIQRRAPGKARFMLLILLTIAGFMTFLLHSQPAMAAQPPQACANAQEISIGKYYLFNNLWGAGFGSGKQCIWEVADNGSNIAWSTKWNWSGQMQVKSFDSVVLGWHWQKPTTTYLTGLPLKISSKQPVRTNWTYNISQNGSNATFNITYDLWLHTIPNPIQNNPSDEVMLWLYSQGGVHPVGLPVATVTMDGTSWELWEGTRSTWKVHTFVRSKNATGAQSLNLSDFLNYLVSNKGVSSAKYLTGVEAGSEVWLGNSELDTSSYSTDVGSVVGVSPLRTPLPVPTPSPTPASSPTLTPTPEDTPTPVITPTPAKDSPPTSQSSGNNWFVVLFLVPVPIAIVAYLALRKRFHVN